MVDFLYAAVVEYRGVQDVDTVYLTFAAAEDWIAASKMFGEEGEQMIVKFQPGEDILVDGIRVCRGSDGRILEFINRKWIPENT